MKKKKKKPKIFPVLKLFSKTIICILLRCNFSFATELEWTHWVDGLGLDGSFGMQNKVKIGSIYPIFIKCRGITINVTETSKFHSSAHIRFIKDAFIIRRVNCIIGNCMQEKKGSVNHIVLNHQLIDIFSLPKLHKQRKYNRNLVRTLSLYSNQCS